ncbi:MAG: hypothetical protein HFH57_15035 [Lachnospiraceae bacterium]|nr:hypothetical protein [Lachnospiraceae bacterium]
MFDKLIMKTHKKSLNFNMDFIMKAVTKARFALIPIVAVSGVFSHNKIPAVWRIDNGCRNFDGNRYSAKVGSTLLICQKQAAMNDTQLETVMVKPLGITKAALFLRTTFCVM